MKLIKNSPNNMTVGLVRDSAAWVNRISLIGEIYTTEVDRDLT